MTKNRDCEQHHAYVAKGRKSTFLACHLLSSCAFVCILHERIGFSHDHTGTHRSLPWFFDLPLSIGESTYNYMNRR